MSVPKGESRRQSSFGNCRRFRFSELQSPLKVLRPRTDKPGTSHYKKISDCFSVAALFEQMRDGKTTVRGAGNGCFSFGTKRAIVDQVLASWLERYGKHDRPVRGRRCPDRGICSERTERHRRAVCREATGRGCLSGPPARVKRRAPRSHATLIASSMWWLVFRPRNDVESPLVRSRVGRGASSRRGSPVCMTKRVRGGRAQDDETVAELLAKVLPDKHNSVARYLSLFGVQPNRSKIFWRSNDPYFVESIAILSVCI
jgi:hypothetical protein